MAFCQHTASGYQHRALSVIKEEGYFRETRLRAREEEAAIELSMVGMLVNRGWRSYFGSTL